ncbi:MAG: hypothetical protein HOY79_18930 [Streptomyces sp.]|nr:hypothetical protein [Streptomyces sp.]
MRNATPPAFTLVNLPNRTAIRSHVEALLTLRCDLAAEYSLRAKARVLAEIDITGCGLAALTEAEETWRAERGGVQPRPQPWHSPDLVEPWPNPFLNWGWLEEMFPELELFVANLAAATTVEQALAALYELNRVTVSIVLAARDLSQACLTAADICGEPLA